MHRTSSPELATPLAPSQFRPELIALLGQEHPIDDTLPARLTQLTERWLVAQLEEVFTAAQREVMLFFALGSLAREELCLQSDVDLLIEVHRPALLDEPDFAHNVEQLMDRCRQEKLRLKHAVRTPEQGVHELEQDWRTPISLLDARLLLGDAALLPASCSAQRALEHVRGEDRGERFVDSLLEAHRARSARQNQTLYLLEPDLKAGLGALRDVNTLRWASLVRFGVDVSALHAPEQGWDEAQRIRHHDARAWLLGLRNALHALHDRPHDRLLFSDQEQIARLTHGQHPHPAEMMMRQHYHLTRAALLQMERALRAWGSSAHAPITPLQGHPRFGERGGELVSLDQSQNNDIIALFDALELSLTERLVLSPSISKHIEQLATHLRENATRIELSQALNQRIFSILTHPEASDAFTLSLLDLGLIPALIPEFDPLVCHVQHDVYHVYTTDVHSLKCLERARNLLHRPDADPVCARWPAFAKIAQHIGDRELFLLACLLHDIGKNRGGDHSRRGAALIPAIAARWGMSKPQIEEMTLLVREHLLLSDTSRRRDISDPRVIRDITSRLRTRQTLNMLTCLTFCDMSTVAPDAMNDWRATLLLQLHQHLSHALAHERGERTWPDQRALITARRDELLAALFEEASAPGQLGEDQIEEFLRDLPIEHVRHASTTILSQQLQAYHDHLQRPARSGIWFGPAQQDLPHVTRLIIATRETPGALSRIAGVLSASGMNILSAEILSTSSDRVLDVFHIEGNRSTPVSHAPNPPLSHDRLEKLAHKLRQALDESLDVAELLAQRQRQERLPARHEPEAEVRVEEYPEASDHFTVLELRGADRLGLLYDIANTFYAHGVETRFSKLDRLGNQVIDTFYVEETFSGKLSKERLILITEALLAVLSPAEPSA